MVSQPGQFTYAPSARDVRARRVRLAVLAVVPVPAGVVAVLAGEVLMAFGVVALFGVLAVAITRRESKLRMTVDDDELTVVNMLRTHRFRREDIHRFTIRPSNPERVQRLAIVRANGDELDCDVTRPVPALRVVTKPDLLECTAALESWLRADN
jgi:hypothetical protein